MHNTRSIPLDRDSLDDYIPIGARRILLFNQARRPSVLALLQSVARHSVAPRGNKEHEGHGPIPPQTTRTLSLICAEHGENWERGNSTVGGVKNLVALFSERDKLDQLSPVPIPTPSCTKRPVPIRPRMKSKPNRLPSSSAFPRDVTIDDALLHHHQPHVYALSFEAQASPSTEASSEGEGRQILLSDMDLVGTVAPRPSMHEAKRSRAALPGDSPMDTFGPVFIPPNYSSVQGQWTQLEPSSHCPPGSYGPLTREPESSEETGNEPRDDVVKHMYRTHWEQGPLEEGEEDRALRQSKTDYPMPTQTRARPKPSLRGLSFTLNASEAPFAQQTPMVMPSPPLQATQPASHPSSFSSGLSYMTPPPRAPALATRPLPSVSSFRSESPSSIYGEDGAEDPISEAPTHPSPLAAGGPKLLSKPPLSQVRPPNLIDNVRCASPEPIEEVEIPVWQIYERIHGRDEAVLAWRNRVQMDDDDDEESVYSDEEEDNGATEDNGSLNWYRGDKGPSAKLPDVDVWCGDRRADKGWDGYADAARFRYDPIAQWGPWRCRQHESPFRRDVPLPIESPPLSPLMLNEDKGISRRLRSLSGCRNRVYKGAVDTTGAPIYKPWGAHNTPHSAMSPPPPLTMVDHPSVGIDASLPMETRAPIDNKDDNPLLSVPCLREFSREALDSALSEFASLSKWMKHTKIRTMFADTMRWPPAPMPGIHRWNGIGDFPVPRDAPAWPPRLQHAAIQSTFAPPGLPYPPRYVQKLPLLLQPEPAPLRFNPFAEEDDDLIHSGPRRSAALFDDDEAYFDGLSKEIDLSRTGLADDSPEFCASPQSAEPALEDDDPVDVEAHIVDQPGVVKVPSVITSTRLGSQHDASGGGTNSLQMCVGSLSKVHDKDQRELKEGSSDKFIDLEDGNKEHAPNAAFEDEDRADNIADFKAYKGHESGFTSNEIDELDVVDDDEASVVNDGDDDGAKTRSGPTKGGDGRADANQSSDGTSSTCRPAFTTVLGLGLIARFASQGFRMTPLQAGI